MELGSLILIGIVVGLLFVIFYALRDVPIINLDFIFGAYGLNAIVIAIWGLVLGLVVLIVWAFLSQSVRRRRIIDVLKIFVVVGMIIGVLMGIVVILGNAIEGYFSAINLILTPALWGVIGLVLSLVAFVIWAILKMVTS